MKKLFLFLFLFSVSLFAGSLYSAPTFLNYDGTGYQLDGNSSYDHHYMCPLNDTQCNCGFTCPLPNQDPITNPYYLDNNASSDFYNTSTMQSNHLAFFTGFDTSQGLYVYYSYHRVCPVGVTYDTSSQTCKNLPACSSDQVLNSSGQCVPACPSPFHYITLNNKSYCSSSNLSKSACLSSGFNWFNNIAFKGNPFLEVLPTGCYQKNITSMYINTARKKLSLALSITSLPGLGVFVTDASSSVFAKFKKIFGGVKSLYYFIKSKFTSSNSIQNLTNQNIKVTDLKMTPDGVQPVVDVSPVHSSLPSNVAFPTSSKGTASLPTDNFDFSSLSLSSDKVDNIPASSVISHFSDNILGTKSILDKAVDTTSFLSSATVLDKPVTSKISLPDNFSSSSTQLFSISSVKISDVKNGTYPVSHYVQTITYPDKSITTLNIAKTDMGSSGVVYDVQTSTPLVGGDVFKKTFHFQKSSSGSITNFLQDPATITKVSSTGSTSVVSNSAPTTVIASKQGINLQPISDQLNNLSSKIDTSNKHLQNIDDNLKDIIDFKPPVNDNFDESLKNFQNGISNFDLNVSNFLNYLKNFKTTFNNLKSNFDKSKKILDNKPTFTQNVGMCGFNVHAFHQSFHVDPCQFVTPYRPLLVLFFTLLGNVFVFVFAVKFLISKGDDK